MFQVAPASCSADFSPSKLDSTWNDDTDLLAALDSMAGKNISNTFKISTIGKRGTLKYNTCSHPPMVSEGEP